MPNSNRRHLRVIIHSTWTLGLLNILEKAISFVTLAILARQLGVDDFGSFTLILTTLAFQNIVANFGTTPIYVRRMSAPDLSMGEKRAIMGGGLVLKVLLWAVSSVLLLAWLSVSHYGETRSYGILLGAAGVLALVLAEIFHGALQAELDIAAVGWASVIERGVFLGLVLLAVGMDWQILGIVAVMVASQGARLSFLAYRARNRLGAIRWPSQPFADLWPMIRQGSPVLTIGLASAITARSNVFFLEHDWGAHAVGLLGAMQKITEVFLLIPGYFIASLYPILCQIATDHPRFDLFCRNAFRAMALFSAMAVTFLISYGDWLIQGLFGPAFAGATVALQLASLGLLFTFIQMVNEYALLAIRAERFAMSLSLGCAAVSVLLNMLLIPRFGLLGSAMSTVAAAASYFVLQNVLAAGRRFVWIIMAAACPPMLIAALLFSAMWWSGLNLHVYFPAYLLLYLAGLFGLGIVRVSDIKNLRA